MPLDPTKPEDGMDIPAFPAYLRNVWLTNVAPAYVVSQIHMYKLDPVTSDTDVDTNVIVGAGPKPAFVRNVYARVKTPSNSGQIGVDVRSNGVSIMGAPFPIPQGMQQSQSHTPQIVVLGAGDVMSFDVTSPGAGAADMSVSIIVEQGVVYP